MTVETCSLQYLGVVTWTFCLIMLLYNVIGHVTIHYCGVWIFPLKMHYGVKRLGQIGEGSSDFDP